ncbi:MAG: EamA family transporter RarD [Spirochaetota bacterium]
MKSKPAFTIPLSEKAVGTWYAVGAFSLWGLLPLYWKALKHVPASQILGHRIFWSFVFSVLLLLLRGRLREARDIFSHPKNRWGCVLRSFILGANWFFYIWGVNTGQVVETSMGYFINPLLSVLLGVVFLRERLSAGETAAVFLAFSGVLYMTLEYGRLPWLALCLAFTFGMYGLLRKVAHVDSLVGLSGETAFLSPFALGYLLSREFQGAGTLYAPPSVTHLLLVGAGAVTAVPLIWFAHGVRRIPLSMVGFIQYLAPTLMLILGVFAFKEPFTPTHLVSFSCIWTALAVYSLAKIRQGR